MRTDLQLSQSPQSHWLSPNHNGYSSLSGSEDQSCWIHSPSAGNPINLQEELFHGATLSSHLNIYSQPPWLSLLTNCASLFLTSSFISRLHPCFLIPSYVPHPSLFHLCPFLSAMVWFVVFSILQEVFLRPTQLFVTITELAAKKKCSGWGHCTCCTEAFPSVVLLLYPCSLLHSWKTSPGSFLCNCPVSYFLFCLCLFSSHLSCMFLFQDVDTIYHSQDNREFNLLDFSHLDSRWHSLFQTSITCRVITVRYNMHQ